MSMVVDDQVLYQNRWVSRQFFRAFVYNSTGQKLVNSYDEFSQLISSGTWFADKEEVPKGSDEGCDTVVELKKRRGNKCHNQQKA